MKTMMKVIPFSLLVACSGPMPGEDGGKLPIDSGVTAMDGDTTDSGVTCGPSNCLGCCFNGTCQTGTSNTGCGKNGAKCLTCNGNVPICSAAQVCGVDPEGMWKVQPVSAQIATTNNGSSWDFGGGAPDPFVDVWCPSTSSSPTRTPTALDTFTPMWATGGCVAKAKDLIASGFALDAWDEDVSVNDSIAGKGTISVTESELLAGYIDGINNKPGPLLTLKVVLTAQ